MRYNKKGVIEVQFNYIFIVIVGVIILSFFISVASWYKNKTDIDIAYDALRDIETIATGAQVSSDTNTQIEVPNIEFEFSCTDCNDYGCASSIDFENKGVASKPWTEVEVLFAPATIEDDFLISWSLSWKIPFRVCDFLYITSSNVQYVLIGNSDTAKAVENKLKENKFIDVKRINNFDSSGISAINKAKRIKLVFFTDPKNSLDSFATTNADRIDGITYINGNEESGKATFYEYIKNADGSYTRETQGTYGYLMMPSLIGAVYSSDYEFYRCNMQKAMLRARTVSAIYADKADKLSSTGCPSDYSSAKGTFDSFGQMFAQRNNFNPEQYTGSISTLKTTNSNLLLRDCERIY